MVAHVARNLKASSRLRYMWRHRGPDAPQTRRGTTECLNINIYIYIYLYIYPYSFECSLPTPPSVSRGTQKRSPYAGPHNLQVSTPCARPWYAFSLQTPLCHHIFPPCASPAFSLSSYWLFIFLYFFFLRSHSHPSVMRPSCAVRSGQGMDSFSIAGACCTTVAGERLGVTCGLLYIIHVSFSIGLRSRWSQPCLFLG